MERKSKLKLNKIKILNIILLLLLLIIGITTVLVESLSFTSSPLINGGGIVYTTNDLVCAWGPSADANTSNISVSWYNNSIFFIAGTIVGNTSTLDDQYTTREDSWICQVTIDNGTNILSQNTSATINNTAPLYPVLKISGTPIDNYYNLYEDAIYSIVISATDADGDILTYDMTDSATYEVCTLQSIDTGVLSCNASHYVINQSTLLGPEGQRNHTIRIYTSENSTPGLSAHSDFTFTLIPQNDQAYFNGTVSSQSVNSGVNWTVVVRAADEELNYPVNFTVSTLLNSITPGLVTITNTSSTSANITFSQQTTNAHAGTWNVTVNITDANGTNASRLPTQMIFTLQINSSNIYPNFTTNFSWLGNQTYAQYGSLLFWLNATDENTGDNLSFNISQPTNISLRCSVTFPWNSTTTNVSYLNATGYINVTNLTNNHVACRYVDLIVRDAFGGYSNQSNFLINITDVNEPPVIYEIGFDGNISNLSVRKFQNFTYGINTSDPDSITYDSIAHATLTFYHNDSRFSLNSSSGVLTVYPDNDSFIGNWTINITVSDGEYNYSRNMYVEIVNNSAPIINLSVNNRSFSQNGGALINLSALDMDNNTMTLSFYTLTSFSNETYNSSFVLVNNSYAGGYNDEYRRLNFTIPSNLSTDDAQRDVLRRRNNLVGDHMLNIVFTDEYGYTIENVSSGILNFTITNDNDAPFFDLNKNNVSDNISDASIFDFVSVNLSYSLLINVSDFDLLLGAIANESLTFNYSNASSGIGNMSLASAGAGLNAAWLNFTCNTTGMQGISINVTDSGNLSAIQNISFEVHTVTAQPTFYTIKPYFNTTLNQTVNSFVPISLYSENRTNLSITENTTLIFDAFVTNESESGNYLTYYWYLNGVLVNTAVNVIPTVNSSFTKYFDFFSSNQTHNVTLIVADAGNSSSFWTWIVNASNVNRAPVYCPSHLQDVSVNRTTSISDYLSYSGGYQRFYDPDDDPNHNGDNTSYTCDDYYRSNLSSLTYEIYETVPCSIAEFTVINSDFIVTPTLTGICQIQFIAEDNYGINVTSSDIVDIVITEVAEATDGADSTTSSGGSSTRTQVVTVPIEEEVDKPVPIKILAPGVVNTYVNKTIYISLKIKNTWTTDVRGIELSGVNMNATMANESNVTIKFSRDYFPNLQVGEESETILEISNYRKDGPFEIVVTAKVANPEFTDSASILISALEQSSRGDEIKAKITFAKDLLSENSACRELNELIDRADKEVKSASYEEALKLIDGVINGCKYLMEQEEVRRESPSVIKEGFDLAREYTVEIIAGAGLILIIVLILYAVAALRKKLSE